MSLIRRTISKLIRIPHTVDKKIELERQRHYFQRISHIWCKKHPCVLSKSQIAQIKEYWRPYSNKFSMNYHNMYTSITGKFDVRFIPDDLFYSVFNPYFNECHSTMANKSYFPLLFDCKLPAVAFQKINGFYQDKDFQLISEDQAIRLCEKFNSVIFKPSLESYGGHNIKIVNCANSISLKETLQEYNSKPSFIVQEVITQHENLSAIHKSSINTIRIVTLLMENKVHVLPPVLRMGVNNSIVDNASSGGIVSGILPDGHLMRYAYSADGTRFEKHPQGAGFKNCIVPSLDKIMDTVQRLAPRLPYNRYVAWDMTVGEDGEPILIEANLSMGGIHLIQYTHGPMFGDMTDDVLREVFVKY